MGTRLKLEVPERSRYLLIHEDRLSLFESIKCIRGLRVARFVRVDQERFHAIAFLDVGFGHAGFQVEHGVRVEFEGFEDAVDFRILYGMAMSAWLE